MSADAKYLRKKRLSLKSEGKCVWCRSEKSGPYVLCDPCRKKNRDAARARSKFNPWHPGSKGRPPIDRLEKRAKP